MTVETFPISETQRVDVDRLPEGDYGVFLRRGDENLQARFAFGFGEQGLRNATSNARGWASAMRADAAWFAR